MTTTPAMHKKVANARIVPPCQNAILRTGKTHPSKFGKIRMISKIGKIMGPRLSQKGSSPNLGTIVVRPSRLRGAAVPAARAVGTHEGRRDARTTNPAESPFS